MPFLVATVAILSIVVLFNLLITFAILRRMRSHEERLAGGAQPASPRSDLVGRRLPEFTATGTRGETVESAAFIGSTRLVGFFSASCGSCREQAIRFSHHDDPSRIAFVVLDSPDEADHSAILTALEGSPTVITEPASVEVSAALGVRLYPQVMEIDADGTIVDARHSLATLAMSVR